MHCNIHLVFLFVLFMEQKNQERYTMNRIHSAPHQQTKKQTDTHTSRNTKDTKTNDRGQATKGQ